MIHVNDVTVHYGIRPVLRYDYVLLAPALILAVATGTILLLQSLAAPPAFTITASLAAAVAATFNLGPSLNHWKLTGAHRLFSTGDRSKGKTHW